MTKITAFNETVGTFYARHFISFHKTIQISEYQFKFSLEVESFINYNKLNVLATTVWKSNGLQDVDHLL